MKNIEEYIESGILESYVLGMATPEEVTELLSIQKVYPEVEMALHNLEVDVERIAGLMAIPPPADTWNKIESQLNEVMLADKEPVLFKEYTRPQEKKATKGSEYIEVEEVSDQMRVHKAWKWVFAAVFVLGKIFLGCAIYFYLENRQAQQQIQDLKTELKQIRK
ncbi:beta/alpha barrel domain-containing protein [Mucilaginibacter ginkgonis]|uniref:Uncharacterized protein n=1 Tax=Mucilaginibacter ginkgonis TaxID=2682091 RepID=A0A6I4I4Z1_9SPHI|nr:hypothetical protein [Mucilaginibacter ginkgonis]QQL50745.1 hypothetical protein GO620_004610 [Mucilaginibacter ginkgonis]